MPESKSVVVVGGGVIGLCVAYYAMRRGHRVTLLERNAPNHDGCSLGNAGLIVPSHFVPLAAPGMIGLGLKMMLRPSGPFSIRPRASRELAGWIARFCRAANAGHVARSAPLMRDLSLASLRCYEEMAGEAGFDIQLTRNGLLMLCKTERVLHEEAAMAKEARGLGLSAEVLTPAEVARLDPGMRAEVAGGVYFAGDGHLTPGRLMAALARALEAGGADLRWSTEAIGWRTTSQRIDAVRTPAGEVTADEFVLAGGSWSPGLARGLGLRLPIQAGKGYSVTLPHPRQLPAIPSLLTEARVAVTPMGSSLRFAGTMEITGLDRSIHRPRVAGMLRAITTYFPEFTLDDFAGAPVWSGLRPCSPDGLPYVGRTARYENLCIAAGHAMLGVSLGPITGRLVSEIVSGERPSIEIGALDPDRYG